MLLEYLLLASGVHSAEAANCWEGEEYLGSSIPQHRTVHLSLHNVLH